MAEVKLTKNELRTQQRHLLQLRKYLPTLQLKKAMLQIEVNEARLHIDALRDVYRVTRKKVEDFSSLLSDKESIDLRDAAHVARVNRYVENIAGVEVPQFESVEFVPFEYHLFGAPAWVDAAIIGLRKIATAKAEVDVAEEKKRALEKELREVSIRVNLFEKVLIPRAIVNIKKIKVFLGDQQLAAVSQAKVAKLKIEERKAAAREKSRLEKEAAYAN